MIRFFRKIRQDLLSDNKFSKYFIYAIGEIVLVMIGILLALQVNTWNKQKNDHKEEKQILTQLKAEFLVNLAQLEDKFLLRENLINGGIEILDLVNNPLPNLNIDTLNSILAKTVIAPTFDASLGATNEIINSGKLYLIENDSLRQMISGWSGNIDFAIEEEIAWREQRNQIYLPFLTENYLLRNIFDEVFRDSRIVKIMTADKNVEIRTMIGKSTKEVNLNDFLVKSELEDHISNMLTFNYVAKIQMVGLKVKIETILKMIDSELANK